MWLILPFLGFFWSKIFYPVTDANFDTPSYRKYEEGYWLTREAMKWFWNNYTSNETNRKEPTVSPVQASIEQLSGLPPALIINGENDVLCDEREAYALKLLQAGVRVTTFTGGRPSDHCSISRYYSQLCNVNAITNDPAPRGVIVGPDGAPWVTDGGLNDIVRVNLNSKNITVFSSSK